MIKYRTVGDYFRDAEQPQQGFLKQYPHPFLVIVHKPGGEDDESGAFFLTKSFLSLEDKDSTLGGGPALDPKDVVLPVKKTKKSSDSSESPLASTIMVGRNEDNDLVIPSSGISKYHFYITPRPFAIDEYTISDNASTNGTYVNMQKVESTGRFPLQSGDTITVASAIAFRFFLAADFWETLQEHLQGV